jgi:hypothetical protein
MTKLFEQAAVTYVDNATFRLAFGKAGAPTVNMTVSDFVTMLDAITPWQYPALNPGYTSDANNPVKYRRNIWGQLEIVGAFTSSGTAINGILFTLPSGYRPEGTGRILSLPFVDISGNLVSASILSDDGVVYTASFGGQWEPAGAYYISSIIPLT